MNADVCSEFPLPEMLDFQKEHGDAYSFVILGTTVRSSCVYVLNHRCISVRQAVYKTGFSVINLSFVYDVVVLENQI